MMARKMSPPRDRLSCEFASVVVELLLSVVS